MGRRLALAHKREPGLGIGISGQSIDSKPALIALLAKSDSLSPKASESDLLRLKFSFFSSSPMSSSRGKVLIKAGKRRELPLGLSKPGGS